MDMKSRRNFDRVVDMLWWPVLDIVMWGFFSIYLTHGKRLQPNIVSMSAGRGNPVDHVLLFQRDMAVGFIDDLWCRNLINLFSTPLTLSEYMAGIIVGLHSEGDRRTVGGVGNRVGGLLVRHFAVAAEVPSLHGEPVGFRACASE